MLEIKNKYMNHSTSIWVGGFSKHFSVLLFKIKGKKKFLKHLALTCVSSSDSMHV